MICSGIVRYRVAFELNITVGVFFHVHEDQRCQFETANDDLDRCTGVSSAAPWVLNVGYLLCIDAKRVG